MADLSSYINIAANTITTDGNIVMAAMATLKGDGASPAPSLSGFTSVSAVDLSAIGNITAGANLDIDGEGTIGGNLTIVGNVNFSGGGSINQITSPFGYFTGNADGSNALYAGVPGGTIVPNAVAQFTGDSNAYMQVNMQNKNHGTQASIEYVITGDLGTDTQDYIDIGFASSTWDGTQDNSLGTAVAARDGWMYVQGGGGGGNLVLGTTTSGTKIKFNAGGPNSANTVATIDAGGISATGNITAGHLKGEAGNISNVQVGNIAGLGNIATVNLTGSSSNVLYGNGVFAAPAGGTYGDSNVVTLLGAFGSNTVSTTGNVTAGNLKSAGNVVFSANSSQVVFNTTAYVSGNASSLNRDGSILLSPYTGAGSNFAGVIIGGSGRLLSPGGSVHQIFNSNDVTFQVAIKNITGLAATSTTSGALQITGGGGFTGSIYVGNSIVRTGPVTQTAWTTGGVGLQLPTAIYTDNSTSTGTQAASYIHSMGAPALAFTNAVTVTNAATLFAAAPTAGTNATINNAYAIVASGAVSASGTVTGGNLATAGNVTATGNITTAGQIVRTTATMNAPSWGSNGAGLILNPATYNDTTASAGTQATSYIHSLGAPTLSYSTFVTVTNASTLYVDQPIAGSNATLGNVWAIVANGAISASGNVKAGNLVAVANVTAGNVNATNVSVTGNISGNTNGFTIGYLNVPQVAAGNVTLSLNDAGKHYYSTGSGNFTLTIPTSINVGFVTGTAISIVMQGAGNILVNAASGVTLYMAGNSTSANRVVGSYGMATLLKVGTDTWFINGTGVS